MAVCHAGLGAPEDGPTLADTDTCVAVQSQAPSQLLGQAQAPYVAMEVRLVLPVELLYHAPRSKCEVLSEKLHTCFIYTDGLLDDLCAIEYLAEKYDHAVFMLQDPKGLADNPYASDQVKDESSFYAAVSPWFTSAEPYSDNTDISDADFYLLAPLTEFAGLLKDNSSLKSKRALMMAGDSEGPDGAGGDWNAVMDLDAYRYVTETMTDLVQITRPDGSFSSYLSMRKAVKQRLSQE